MPASEPTAVAAAVAREAKARLREAMKARRAAIPAPERAAGSAAVAASGLDFLALPGPVTVSAFRSFGEELDTAPILARLSGEGHRLCLPVMLGKGRPLAFRAWAPGDGLRTVLWGIEEPLEGAEIVDPDVLLVPLLAWDAAGYRLGYGGGFYDRTLAGLRARRRAVAVGLAFAQQKVDAVPHLDYDQRLDWILTPSGPVRCPA